MYFRSSLRKNPATGSIQGYWRLVESYRNEDSRVCHRTLLNVGFIDYNADKLVDIQHILNNRFQRKILLFEQYNAQTVAIADKYWDELVSNGKIDASEQAFVREKSMVNMDTIKHKDVREIGAEWMCFNAIKQLQLKDKLSSLGFTTQEVQLAITQIICRAIYPYSEHKTTRIIRDNSGICEVTGYPQSKMTKDKLYKSALHLYQVKDSLERHLSVKTTELFDLQDKILLYDLTNTYFEGRKTRSAIADFGRSKEKRNDCKIVVLALVINVEGFVKYSNIFEGNTADSKTLPHIIDNLRSQTSTDKRAIVVIDAGIASEENLKTITEKGYDYVCVSRSKIKDYTIHSDDNTTQIQTKNNQTVTLQRVVQENNTEYILKIKSTGKHAKEQSMKHQFEERFIEQIQAIQNSLTKKHGVKKADKVHQRIGRAIEKYPSVAKFYNIEVITEAEIATQVHYSKKASSTQDDADFGSYFIKTNLNPQEEVTLWTIYNSIREIEQTFRTLKTDLDLRPIYHKNDDATMAHLHLGILAYWVVNTIRHQLKIKDIRHDWQEIVRITSTQKVITSYGKNRNNEEVAIRKCSEPNEEVKKIYTALNFENYPFTKRKSVVHKSELKNNQTQQQWETETG